jgi:hypothetical protein
MTRPPRKYRRCMISHHFFCMHEIDMTSNEVQKVRDITSFLLHAERWPVLLRTTKGSRYHILSFACMKLTWHPRKYRRFQISHPFIACGKMTRPPRKYRRFHISHPFIACGKMTCPHTNYRRFQISRPFYCMRKDDVSSYELQKVRDITSFLLHACSWRGLLGNTEGSRYHDLFFACKKLTCPPRRTTEGSRYHDLFIACGKMTRHPRNYRRCQISRPFYCLWEDDAAS